MIGPKHTLQIRRVNARWASRLRVAQLSGRPSQVPRPRPKISTSGLIRSLRPRQFIANEESHSHCCPQGYYAAFLRTGLVGASGAAKTLGSTLCRPTVSGAGPQLPAQTANLAGIISLAGSPEAEWRESRRALVPETGAIGDPVACIGPVRESGARLFVAGAGQGQSRAEEDEAQHWRVRDSTARLFALATPRPYPPRTAAQSECPVPSRPLTGATGGCRGNNTGTHPLKPRPLQAPAPACRRQVRLPRGPADERCIPVLHHNARRGRERPPRASQNGK